MTAGASAAGPGTGSASVGVEAPDDRVVLQVLGRDGEVLHREPVGDEPWRPEDAPGGGEVRLLAATDEALLAAGWVRTGGWRPVPAGEPGSASRPAWTAGTTPVPRAPLDAAGLRALDTLGYLTRVARGPVTVGALVPHVAPSRHLAAVLVRRLVVGGHARAVGSTAGARPQALYAPVGSPWAPARGDS